MMEGKKLTIRPLPLSTVRKLILLGVGKDKQLSHEALEIATEHWENAIINWAKEDLLAELQKTNDNPNKPKGRGYEYKRISGLMVQRTISREGE